ncbi:DUF302 domain-containing protein [Marinobacterium jannaschii]|uniref:DUF302 domain-containing protein n=1 Tax=Marinobacterium jannaschii TaxID=64970 RepID=UPI0004878343|nr:DUF302 domain-containing protein [Marinobacterium jannaschii]
MKRLTVALLLSALIALPAQAAEGMTDVASAHDVETTADRFEQVLKKKGMTIFNRLRHSEGASKVGIELRDTQLVIFGNPKVGSPLMKCAQSVAIDLPQKALIWQDPAGQTYISYNDPQYLKQRHNIQGCDKVLGKVTKALAGMSQAAAAE